MNELARNPKQLGNLLRTARKRKGWTQSDLAERVGLQQRQISIIESGYGSTKVQVLLVLLAALDLDLQIAPRAVGDWKLPF